MAVIKQSRGKKRPYSKVSSGRSLSQTYKKPYVVGKDRVSGYYGRYSGPNPERKFFDVVVDNTSTSAAGTILNSGSVVNIAQGTGESNRVARKCTIRSIHARAQCIINAETLAADNTVVMRIIFYLDKQCNGAAAVVTDILESANYQSFNNLANKNRFTTLMDKTVTLNVLNGTATATGAVSKTFKFNKKCNIPLEFDNTTGAITEIKSNNIGVLVITSSSTVDCAYLSQMRFRFDG